MSTLKVTNIQATGETASRAVSGVAAAWVNYYHISGTPTAQNSMNVSSLTDVGTGRVSINITNNMANVNYAGAGLAGHDSGTGSSGKTAQLDRQGSLPFAVGAVQVQTVYDPTASISDVINDSRATFIFHGDLA